MSSENIYTILSSIEHNQHYLYRYIKFIKNCQDSNVKIVDGYTEKHHICPKSLFPMYKSFIDNPWNMVILSARQHFIAHWILSKIFTGVYRFSMIKAFHNMTVSSTSTKDRYISSVGYEIMKNMHSESMKIFNPMFDPIIRKKSAEKSKESWTEEKRKRISAARTGVSNISEEGKTKLSEMWKGVPRPKTDDQLQKIAEACSCGSFVTPWGIFLSPQKASDAIGNIEKLTRYQINRRCKNNSIGFSFKPNGKEETRGRYKK